jgi:hypothetical protein
MNLRTTSLLFGILIAMLLVFGIALQAPRNQGDQGYVFATIGPLPSLNVGTVLIEHKGKEIRLVKSDRGWRLELPPATATARADETKVEQLIDQVRGARKVEEAEVTRDLARVGLENPETKVTLKEKGAGREWTLYVGDKSPDKEYVYVTSSDRPKEVMAVSASTLESIFFDSPDALRATALLDVSDANANSVALSAPAVADKKEKKEKTEVALAKTREGLWVFKAPADYGAADFAGTPPPKEEPGVKGLLTALGNLRVENVKDFEPLGAKPLADYGVLPGKETLRVAVERTPFGGDKGKTIKEALLVGNKVKGKDEYYVRAEQDDSVARVAAKKLETVLRVAGDPAVLRSRNLTEVERNAVDVVDLRWGTGLKQEVRLRRPDPTLWEVYEGGKWQKANEPAVAGDRDSLLAAVKGQGKVEEFFDRKDLDEKLGFGSPTAEVKVYVGGLEKKAREKAGKGAKEKAKEPTGPALKKGAAPAVTLIFGKTDKDRVYVKRVSASLGTSRVAVPASILEKVAPPEGALAYLDTSLPSPPVADVVKLQLDRGATRFVVEKTKEKAKEKEKGKAPAKAGKEKAPAWQLIEPKDLPGRTSADEAQVDVVLQTLAHLQVEKWVRKIDPKDKKGLAEYGLEAPGLAATMTVKKGDKTEDYVYQFGKDAGDGKKGVYALLNKTDIVFLAQPQAVQTLREAELRDLTIFTFDPAKVKDVVMQGWYEKANYVFELLLERKSGDTWAAPKLKGFEVSGKAVSDFVKDLSRLRAKQLVTVKAKSLTEYKLAPADKNLRVEVKMDDGKTSYTLTVGALNKDGTGYYATASTLPDVVLLLPKERFEAVVGSYNYFSRTKQASAK